MRLLVITLAALTGCAPTAQPKAPARPAADLTTLVIPVQHPDKTRATLDELATRAEAGDTNAAWTRVHYLIDLFDDARFRRDDTSLTLLHQTLGHQGKTRRGSAATDQVLAGLLREVDNILARDRLHEAALAARTVLEFDSRPPTSRLGLFARMAELKAVARARTALSDNALLRLAGWCRQALGDVPRSKYAERTRVIAHCLYPLYDSDPEPYFAENPENRPPPPHWQDLVDTASALSQQVATGTGRLAHAGTALARELTAIKNEAAGTMPDLPDATTLNLPHAQNAVPYDWTPLLLLGKGEDLSALDDLQEITRLVQGDGRQVLAVALSQDAPAELLLKAAGAAQSAGAQHLQLAVTSPQELKIPPGDYWYGRTEKGRVIRWAMLDLPLAALEKPARARTPGWDPQRATLGLVLEVQGAAWRLAAPEGEVAVLSEAGAEARGRALAAALRQVSRAFPDEDGLLIAPGPGASVADLVAAMQAAGQDEQGRPLMGQVGLRAAAPVSMQNTLAQRIARRAGARVDIVPAALAVRAPAVQSCYQDLLEKKPSLGGRVRLELQNNEVTVTQGPRDKDLRACVLKSLAEPMKTESMASAAVELAPR